MADHRMMVQSFCLESRELEMLVSVHAFTRSKTVDNSKQETKILSLLMLTSCCIVVQFLEHFFLCIIAALMSLFQLKGSRG